MWGAFAGPPRDELARCHSEGLAVSVRQNAVVSTCMGDDATRPGRAAPILVHDLASRVSFLWGSRSGRHGTEDRVDLTLALSWRAASQAFRIVAQYTAYAILYAQRCRSAPPSWRCSASHAVSLRLNSELASQRVMENTMKVQVYTHPG